MSETRDTWWQEEFRASQGQKGIDFVSQDARTVVHVQRSPQGTQAVNAGLMSLGVFLAENLSVDRACLIIDASHLSKDRLLRVWNGSQALFKPEIAGRLSLIAIGKEESLIEPNDRYLHRMAAAFKSIHPFAAAGQLPSQNPKIFRRQRYFEIAKVLLVRWLLREGPIATGKLAQAVGCTYPTVREALQRMDQRQYLKRYSNRSVELVGFPHDTWSELTVLSSPLRSPVRFIDSSGQKPDPHFLLKQLERLRPPSVAVGGVIAAALWHPNFDLHGMPRLDLVVHSTDGLTDIGFVKRLDPALKEAKTINESPVLVLHSLSRAAPFFQTRPESQMPIADPIETALDLVEMGLTAQAGQLLHHFRPEVRI